MTNTKLTVEKARETRAEMLREEGFENITEQVWELAKNEKNYKLHSALFSELPHSIYANEDMFLIFQNEFFDDMHTSDWLKEELEGLLDKKNIQNAAYVMNGLGRDWVWLTK